jgi:hypothetical protein
MNLRGSVNQAIRRVPLARIEFEQLDAHNVLVTSADVQFGASNPATVGEAMAASVFDAFQTEMLLRGVPCLTLSDDLVRQLLPHAESRGIPISDSGVVRGPFPSVDPIVKVTDVQHRRGDNPKVAEVTTNAARAVGLTAQVHASSTLQAVLSLEARPWVDQSVVAPALRDLLFTLGALGVEAFRTARFQGWDAHPFLQQAVDPWFRFDGARHRRDDVQSRVLGWPFDLGVRKLNGNEMERVNRFELVRYTNVGRARGCVVDGFELSGDDKILSMRTTTITAKMRRAFREAHPNSALVYPTGDVLQDQSTHDRMLLGALQYAAEQQVDLLAVPDYLARRMSPAEELGGSKHANDWLFRVRDAFPLAERRELFEQIEPPALTGPALLF